MADERYFIVVNGSATHTITHLSAIHVESGASVLVGSLLPGNATLPVKIPDEGADFWDIIFNIEGKQVMKRTSKVYSTSAEDYTMGMVIILYPQSFSIVPPKSAPCLNIYY